MWKTGKISIHQHAQPNKEAWDIVSKFAKEWNKNHLNAILKNDYGTSWYTLLERSEFYLYPEIVNDLNSLKGKHGVFFLHYTNNHYEEGDYLAADFIKFSAGQLITERPFVLNLEDISPSGDRCSKCGAWYALTHTTAPSPLLIDENLLKNPTNVSAKPSEKAWDIIHAYGHYLISPRFKQLLEANDIKGYTLGPALSHQTNKASEKVYQFFANKSILITALPEGETVQPICDKCGTAHVPYDYDFAIKKEWVGEDDFFAQDAYKGTCLHMSNRVFNKLVREHQLTGFRPMAVVATV